MTDEFPTGSSALDPASIALVAVWLLGTLGLWGAYLWRKRKR